MVIERVAAPNVNEGRAREERERIVGGELGVGP
jgi:hypothetical protein